MTTSHADGYDSDGYEAGRDGRLSVGHIGDSRLYRLTTGQLEQLTRDHTWVQREVDEGRLEAAMPVRIRFPTC